MIQTDLGSLILIHITPKELSLCKLCRRYSIGSNHDFCTCPLPALVCIRKATLSLLHLASISSLFWLQYWSPMRTVSWKAIERNGSLFLFSDSNAVTSPKIKSPGLAGSSQLPMIPGRSMMREAGTKHAASMPWKSEGCFFYVSVCGNSVFCKTLYSHGASLLPRLPCLRRLSPQYERQSKINCPTETTK